MGIGAVSTSSIRKIANAYSQLPQYLGVGILSVAVNLIAFWIANLATENIYIATLIGNLTSILVNFTGLHKIFAASSLTNSALKYAASLTLFYFLSVFITLWIIDLGLADLIARSITIALLFPVVYLMNKYLVFK
jgi:putative flippase GtrA